MHDLSYSKGVRQELFRLHSGHPLFSLVDTSAPGERPNYNALVANATFCLVPAGYGFGVRIVEVMPGQTAVALDHTCPRLWHPERRGGCRVSLPACLSRDPGMSV
jgi:hypothetical protein